MKRGAKTILERPTAEDESDPARLTQTHLEQTNANEELRDIVGFLDRVRYFHLVPQLVREPEFAHLRTEDPHGSDFLAPIARTPDHKRRRLPARIREALKLAAPQLSALQPSRDANGSWRLLAQHEHWRRGSAQDERSFSDGALRLVGMLWALSDTPRGGVILLEEPELSLHAAVVRQLAPLFHSSGVARGVQVIATTHSTDILKDPGGVGADEVIALIPGAEGTSARLARELRDAPSLLERGLSIPEILRSVVEPREVSFLGRRVAGPGSASSSP